MANLRHTLSQNLAIADVDEVIAWNYDVLLDSILIHASTAITEEVKIIFDSLDGSAYDTVLDSKQLSSDSDYIYRPAREQLFKRGDGVRITVSNANTTGTVGITIMARIKQQEE